MSNFLAVDTSSRYLSVLAVKGEKRTLRHIPECAMKHSVILMDEVDKAFKEVDLTPRECDFFAAVTGPGSFTGIRIGVSTVKGFALAADKPMLSITSFDLIAYNVNSENFYVVIDAAHGHYYVCGYGADKSVTLEPCYMDGEKVAALGAPLYGFEDLPLNNYTRLDAGSCLYPAVCQNDSKLSREVRALYVRKSQAEEAKKC
ncbi:MAG: tRNA (adenosine(37)-N6)-threonylcarbamoyltransferase complex dimerization subunit type 1 TsaB [Clostridia bacterium]|nr:tRNA (adenosine(37)-N6)-threonylcarbamoyltransferase complex dimerization subunit type 1 TsaB [Clostridia bacterium]